MKTRWCTSIFFFNFQLKHCTQLSVHGIDTCKHTYLYCKTFILLKTCTYITLIGFNWSNALVIITLYTCKTHLYSPNLRNAIANLAIDKFLLFLLLCYRQWHIKRVFIEFELFQFLFNCQNTTQNTAIKIETCLGRYLNTRCELCRGFLPLVVLSQEERSFRHYRQAEVFNRRFLTVTGDWWQLFSLWSHI